MRNKALEEYKSKMATVMGMVFFIGILVACTVVFGVSHFYYLKTFECSVIKEINQTNYDNIDYLMDTINEKCGDTFITKQGSDNENWYVFTNICKDGGYCKHDYINLKQCLGE